MNKKFYKFLALVFICIIATFLIVNQNGKSIKTTNAFITLAEESVAPQKYVYLTFDDGPSNRVTPKILNVLKEEGVKATFFIIGRQAESRKDIVKQAFNEGHTIAVHSYSHEYSTVYSSVENLIKDVEKCNEIIKEITGEYSKIYRFPGGSFGVKNEFIKAVTDKGYRYVDWNASTRDAEIFQATPWQLYNAALNSSADRKNVVLLAHDSTNKSATAQALKDIISYYKKHDYVFAKF